MSTTPPDDESRPEYYRTVVAHFEGLDGEPPPGVRVVEPASDTRQALRGNLYAVVDLVGDHPERAQLAERLLSAIQRTYFTHSGSQSQVLTEAVRQARLRANEFNQGHPDQLLQLGVICVGLVQSRLMIAHSGPGVALVTSQNQVERYPSDVITFDMEDQPDLPATWEIYRQEVGERTALFVGTTRWLDMISIRMIAGTVAHITTENCGDAASGLLAESRQPDLPGLLLVIERTATPPPEPTRSRVPLKPTPKRPPFLGAVGLPVAVNARPPVHTLPAAHSPAAQRSSPSEGRQFAQDSPAADAPVDDPRDGAETSDGNLLQASDGSDEATAATVADNVSQQPPADDVRDSSPAVTALAAQTESTAVSPFQQEQPAGPPFWAKVSSGLAAGALAGFGRSKTMLGGMFPDRRAERDADHAQADSGSDEAWEADGPSPEVAAPTVSFYSDVSARINAALDETATPFDPPEPASGGRSRLFITLAVLIFLLVPVLVYTVNRQRAPDDIATGEKYLEMAEVYLDNGWLALNNGDETSAREMFHKAEESVASAIVLIGNTERTDQAMAEIDLGLDDVMRSRPLYQLFPLLEFPADAEPDRVLVAGDDIFVMDRGRQSVERYEMDALHEFVPNPTPETVLQEAMSVDGATVAGMVDMAWQPIIPGYEERPKLIVLDRNHQLFSYDLRVDGIQSVEIGGASVLENPSQIELFLNKTYIADEGADQIFRYEPGLLSEPPEGWFPENTRPPMSGLLAMAIDGDIWLLNSQGTLVRYYDHEQVPFSLDEGAVRADEPVDMAIGPQADSSIYIADAAHDRILVFDKEGDYLYQLVAAEGEPLENLRGLYLDEVGGEIYILTKNALYQHPLPD